MRVPYEWLREYCAPDLPLEEIRERLTMSGTLVEAIDHHGIRAPERFVVGRVVSAEQHPDADRLTVCRVDVGEGEAVQIVCGAPNVAAGQTVAVARPGAVMPDGTELGRAKLRGIDSEGMILAEDELAIGTDHAGIMVLEDGHRAGAPLADVLPIETPVLELEITPNRPDQLGVYGIARELHAATGAPLAPPPWVEDPGGPGYVYGLHVRVDAPDLNPRFTARVFEDVTIAESPPWLKARLMAAGMRPINNVVDITNYVMLLTGHPLHAFDLDKVAGGELTVRRARDGEQIETLDGQVRTLDSEMVVIEDEEGPTSIAGVMGGARSEVSETTTRVAMEVASWIGPNILRTSTVLGVRSEASARFEKGLAPEQAMEAQAVATKLMIELTGAKLPAGTIDAGPFAQDPWPTPTLRLRAAKVAAILGMPIALERQETLLFALGFGVAAAEDGLDVTVPHFRRNDVTREADLIEEVGRFDLDKLPATLPKRRGVAGHMAPEQRLRRRAVDALVGRGGYEAVGWSFTDPGVADRLRLPDDDPRRRFVVLENPMSEDHGVLRTTLLGSLLDVVRHNRARGADDLFMFEQGAVYAAYEGRQLPDEHRALGGLLHGHLARPSWRSGDAPVADVFAAKAMLEAVFTALRLEWRVEQSAEPFLHPGRAGRVLIDHEPVGWVGELHPLVARAWDLDAGAAFEVDLDRVVAHAVDVPRYQDLTSFPPVRRDLALVAGRDVPAAQLTAAVEAAGAPLLRDVSVFDVYEGEQVGEGRRSIALHLQFQAEDRTLTDEEVEAVVGRILDAAREQAGAEQRG